MIRNFTLLLFLIATISLNAQNINIPDANFKKALVDNTSINTNGDGEISVSEAAAFTGKINVGDKNISDLTGIKYFINITELSCDGNQLTSINVSNILNLEHLVCSRNLLTRLDLSFNTNLKSLMCYDNQLTNLNLINNKALIRLTCNNNKFTTLDLSRNKKLEGIICRNNQLTRLDLSQNTRLKALYCNNNKLIKLDLGKGSKIRYIYCVENQFPFSELQKIKIKFSGLSYRSNKTIFTPLIKNLEEEVNYSAQREFNGHLTTFIWYNDSDLTVDAKVVKESTTSPGVFQFLKAGRYYCKMRNTYFAGAELKTENITVLDPIITFPDANFKNALLTHTGIDIDEDREIKISEALAYSGEINVTGKSISDLIGIEYFINITDLSCNSNLLTNLDVSKNRALICLSCDMNQLKTLNITQNTALTSLSCSSNQLSSLNINRNTLLTDLHCNSNPINKLNVNKNIELTSLSCSLNQLKTLDVTKNKALTNLSCHKNQLKTLDLGENTALADLDCSSNQFEVLDITKNKTLTNLSCHKNQLKTLDLSENTALADLDCSSNRIEILDIQENTALTKLICFSNNFKTLDINKNAAITTLFCYSNQIRTLYVSNNTALINLYCQNNELSKLDISKNTHLFDLKCNNNLFPFSSLKKIKDYYTELNYNSNKLIFQSKEEKFGFEIDFTSEVDFNENKTTFKWFKNNNEIDQNIIKKIKLGIFKPLKTGNYYCEMSNDYFNSTILRTNIIKITKGEQTITFADKPETVKANDEIELNATASSGLAVTFELISGDANITGNFITFNEVGTVEIKASQAGNDEYETCENNITITVDFATGIEDVLESSTQIYPNPVVSEMVVKFKSSDERSIRIFDLQGRLKLQEETSSTSERLNLSDFKSGMYLMKVQSASGSFTYKIIKK